MSWHGYTYGLFEQCQVGFGDNLKQKVCIANLGWVWNMWPFNILCLMKRSIWLHYGKCRLQYFWAGSLLWTKSQDIAASIASILNTLFKICSSEIPQFYWGDGTGVLKMNTNFHFGEFSLVRIKVVRIQGVVCFRPTDCKTPWSQLSFVILGYINNIALIWLDFTCDYGTFSDRAKWKQWGKWSAW